MSSDEESFSSSSYSGSDSEDHSTLQGGMEHDDNRRGQAAPVKQQRPPQMYGGDGTAANPILLPVSNINSRPPPQQPRLQQKMQTAFSNRRVCALCIYSCTPLLAMGTTGTEKQPRAQVWAWIRTQTRTQTDTDIDAGTGKHSGHQGGGQAGRVMRFRTHKLRAQTCITCD